MNIDNFMNNLEENFQVGEPIFTNEIITVNKSMSRATIFRLLNYVEAMGKVMKIDRGIYALAKAFIDEEMAAREGALPPELTRKPCTDDIVEKRYITDGEDVYGIYCGIKLQNLFRATTQMAATIEITTNNESTRRRPITINNRRFVLHKSRTAITKENAPAYMVLQMFTETNGITVDKRSSKALSEYIKNMGISTEYLLDLAQAFPARTTRNLLESGVI